MSKKWIVASCLLGALAFLIPIEHKYDKWFRFYSLTLIPEGLSISSQYEKKIYFYISDLLVLALTFLRLIPLRKWLTNFLWIVWLCALISIIASPFSHYPIPYFRLLQLFTPIALFSFVAHAERDFTKVILHGIVFAGLLQTAIAIPQYFHQAPLGLRILGEVNQTTFFHTADGARSLFDSLLNRKAESTIVMRAAGTFPHANVFGGFMFFSILATYYLAARKKIWLWTLPLQFFALAISYSRSALFAWGLASLIWFCLGIYRAGLKPFIPLAIVITLILGTTTTLLYEQYVHRGGVVNYNSWVKSSDAVRHVQQETGEQIVKDHPLFGVGYTQFSERSSSYFIQNLPHYIRETAPHNIFLFLACECGSLALGAFLLFLAAIFWKFFRSNITLETSLFFSLLIGFLFIGFCDFYPILFQHGKLMFFLIAALLVANAKKDVVQKRLVYEQSDASKCLENV